MKQIAFSCIHAKSVKMILPILFLITACAADPQQKSITGRAADPLKKSKAVSEPLESPVEIFDFDIIPQLIQEKITQPSRRKQFMHRPDLIHNLSLISSFYQKRNFSPAWMGERRDFRSADDLLGEIRTCRKHALKPENYHLNRIDTLLKTIRDDPDTPKLIHQDIAANLDIMLTDAFLLLSSHLLFGLVNPETVHVKGEAFDPGIDLAGVLDNALKIKNIRKTLQNLSPRHQAYLNLQAALKKYQKMASKNGPRPIPPGETLRCGVSHERVRILRNRLIFLGDLKAAKPLNPNFFDADLEKAVKSFQFRHGLAADGLAGPQTVAAMNISSGMRLRQIELNMERWRWLSKT